MRAGERDRMAPAHRVPDEQRLVDRGGVEDRHRIGDEFVGRVSVSGLSALAMSTRVRRHQTQAARDGVGE